ncbi:MAG: hypothetical protein IKV59_01305 [Lachnospiraceae bacterium]|nr:hypothetical protein [Lachnospiraceae bacterium]
MKKKILTALLLIFIFAAAVGAWFYGYYHRKSNDNLPALSVITEIME